jgi:hypothetical protein
MLGVELVFFGEGDADFLGAEQRQQSGAPLKALRRNSFDMPVRYQQDFSHRHCPAKLSVLRMCSSGPHALIWLLNAAKEQPAASVIAAEIFAFRGIATARKQRKRWPILAVPSGEQQWRTRATSALR